MQGTGFWEGLVVLAALGWGASAFSYVAGRRDAEERERRRLIEQHEKKNTAP
jgi:hypothetical protein